MIDWNTIIVGLLSLAGTAIGSWGGMKLMSYRLEQLEKRVDKHNNFAGRMPVVEEQIKEIKHRLHNLEESKEG